MDPLAWDQVQAWIGTTRRGVAMLRRSKIAPIRAIEVSERLYGMLQEYLIETADNLGRDVTDASGALTFMHIPIIADPNLPFEFEPLPDQPTIVATSLDAVATFEEKQPGISRLTDVVFKRPPVRWVDRLSPDPASADPDAQSGGEGLSVSFLAGKGRL